MWTLIVWFYLLPGDLRTVSSVPGFHDKAACEVAGPHIAKSLLKSVKAPTAQVGFVCVAS